MQRLESNSVILEVAICSSQVFAFNALGMIVLFLVLKSIQASRIYLIYLPTRTFLHLSRPLTGIALYAR